MADHPQRGLETLEGVELYHRFVREGHAPPPDPFCMECHKPLTLPAPYYAKLTREDGDVLFWPMCEACVWPEKGKT